MATKKQSRQGVVLSALLVVLASPTWAAWRDRSDCAAEQTDGAIAACTRILDGEQNDADRSNVLTLRGNAYLDKKDWDRAIADFTSAIELDPKIAVAFISRGSAYLSKKNWDRAIADETRAIEIDPKSKGAFVVRGTAYFNKKDWDRAIADETRAIELDPKDAVAFTGRGGAYGKKGDWDRAIADLTRAIELDPKDAKAFQARGFVYNGKNDYDRAIADETRAVELDPKEARSNLWRGVAYFNKGEYEPAIADETRAIELDPKDADFFGNRGHAYMKTGKLDLARADLKKALELKPGYEEVRTMLDELDAETAPKNQPTDASAPPPPTQKTSTPSQSTDGVTATARAETNDQLRACAHIDDSIKRLSCFDSVAASVAPEPAVTPPPAGTTGDWHVETSISKIDDSTNVTLSVEAIDASPGRFGQPIRPTLMILCAEKKTKLAIYFGGEFMTTEWSGFTYRIDKQPAKTKGFSFLADDAHKFLMLGGILPSLEDDPISFTKQLFGHERLLIRASPYDESAITAEFKISALAEAIKPLRQACHW